MLPIYVSFFAGGGQPGVRKTIYCALCFLVGFSAVIFAAGVFAGCPVWLLQHQRIVNLIGGSFITVFGLNQLGLFRWNLHHGGSRILDAQDMTFFSTVWFGILFSADWISCTGWNPVFPVNERPAVLVLYSLGLGFPFLMIAVLIHAVKGTFGWMKRNYQAINLISGSILIVSGFLTASGLLGRLLRYLSQNAY